MKERDIQTVFRDINKMVGIFELKLCKDNAIPFSAVKDHQRQALSQINADTGLFFKIPDSPIFTGSKTRFAVLKPFDCFHLANIPAYVVICWYQPRKYKRFYYIPIGTFLYEEQMSERKSLTQDRAREIAEEVMEG
ncbi:MAG: hypothetical protein ABFD66_13085 [Smithella sp.]